MNFKFRVKLVVVVVVKQPYSDLMSFLVSLSTKKGCRYQKKNQ